MTQARISPFAAAAAAPLSPQSVFDPLPELDAIQRDLDDLLALWACALKAGEDITRLRLLRQALEQAAGRLDEVCQNLRGAGHE